MGNAINAVKEKADCVIGSNDEDGIAEYLAIFIKKPHCDIFRFKVSQWGLCFHQIK